MTTPVLVFWRTFSWSSHMIGKELRLKQQYFFVAASLADIMSHFEARRCHLKELPNYVDQELRNLFTKF